MKCLILVIGSIYSILFLYVIGLNIWNIFKRRKISRNTHGMSQAGLDAALKIQDRTVQNLLLGFTPTEALKYLTDVVVATAAVLGLFYSSR